MSDARTSRLPVVALGAAVVAVVVSVVAAIVVIGRGDSEPVAARSAQSQVPRVVEQSVSASDVYALRDQVEVVVEAGQPTGVRVTDAALAQRLALQADDVIVAISGRATSRKLDVADVLIRAASLRITTLYADVMRVDGLAIMRWQLDGSLLDARRDADVVPVTDAAAAAAALKNPFTDPDQLPALIDQIEMVTETRIRVPRKTYDALVANRSAFAGSARIVPAYKNGKHIGFKLFSIRPSSPLAKLGLRNGDTIHAINGHDLTKVDLDTVLDDVRFFLKVELTRRGRGGGADRTLELFIGIV